MILRTEPTTSSRIQMRMDETSKGLVLLGFAACCHTSTLGPTCYKSLASSITIFPKNTLVDSKRSLVADHLPALRERSKQTAFLNLGRHHPSVECLQRA